MEMDSQGQLGVGRGVYRPCFMMVGLAMAHAVQDLMYLPTSNDGSTNKNTFAVLPLFSLS